MSRTKCRALFGRKSAEELWPSRGELGKAIFFLGAPNMQRENALVRAPLQLSIFADSVEIDAKPAWRNATVSEREFQRKK